MLLCLGCHFSQYEFDGANICEAYSSVFVVMSSH